MKTPLAQPDTSANFSFNGQNVAGKSPSNTALHRTPNACSIPQGRAQMYLDTGGPDAVIVLIWQVNQKNNLPNRVLARSYAMF